MHRPSDEYAVTTNSAHEYAPTEIEIPPPYTFAPEEEEEEEEEKLDVDDNAVQLVKVLFETV
jgi:hypothetical protein